MSKLIMMRGLPASGKSTAAEYMCKEDSNTIRLNRDLLRTMLHFDVWNGKKEDMTVEAEKLLARHFLREGKTVIIDDTNLSKSHEDMWDNIAKEEKATFGIADVETPWLECCIRDLTRAKRVGDSVIIGMARQYGRYDFIKPEVICDIDGTLADIEHRLHFLQGEKKDWRGFFDAMDQDEPRLEIIEKLRELYSQGNEIFLVSGRPENYREVTEKWLKHHDIPYVALFMRKASDNRQDDIVKQEILDKYFDKSKVIKVIDDRPRVIRMWQANGLEVEDVGNGIEF